MAAKLVTLKPWKDVVGSTQIPDKGLQKALTDYKNLKKEKTTERMTAITSINKILGDLKRVPQVAAIPATSKYFTELASALSAEKLDIQKQSEEATIDATITNSSSYDDIFLTVEDLNTSNKEVVINNKRLNKKQSMAVTLASDGGGFGQIHWTAVLADDAASKKDDTVKYIKDGSTIKVSA
jgi:hypothetical protein